MSNMDVKDTHTKAEEQAEPEKFWLHTDVTYCSGFDDAGNYFFELINFKSGKVYHEYLSPVQITAVEYDNAAYLLHPHLHK